MDYQAFYADVVAWIQQANQEASRHGMVSEDFWKWVADSAAELSRKYGDHRLAVKQMVMLIEWLEEFCEQQKGA